MTTSVKNRILLPNLMMAMLDLVQLGEVSECGLLLDRVSHISTAVGTNHAVASCL